MNRTLVTRRDNASNNVPQTYDVATTKHDFFPPGSTIAGVSRYVSWRSPRMKKLIDAHWISRIASSVKVEQTARFV